MAPSGGNPNPSPLPWQGSCHWSRRRAAGGGRQEAARLGQGVAGGGDSTNFLVQLQEER